MEFIKVIIGTTAILGIAALGNYCKQKQKASAADAIREEGYQALTAILQEYAKGGVKAEEKDINVHLKAHFKSASKILSDHEYIKHSAHMKVRIANALK